MNLSAHEEHGLQPTPAWSRRVDWERIVTSVCRIAFTFVAVPCLLLPTFLDHTPLDAICFRVAFGIAIVSAVWFVWRKYLQVARPATPDGRAFSKGQRLTHGELLLTIGCLIVALLFSWMSVDVIINHGNGIGIWIDRLFFYLVPAQFFMFGFACVVATHGKWKLTLAALACFIASIVVFWVGLFVDPPT